MLFNLYLSKKPKTKNLSMPTMDIIVQLMDVY